MLMMDKSARTTRTLVLLLRSVCIFTLTRTLLMCKNKTETCKCCGCTTTTVPCNFDFSIPGEDDRWVEFIWKDTPGSGRQAINQTAADLFKDTIDNIPADNRRWRMLAYAMAQKLGILKDKVAHLAIEATQT